MNCHATRAVLDLHAEGRLSAGRTKAVAAHLESCAECRAAAAPVPTPSSSAALGGDFKARLSAAMKAERKVPVSRPEPELNLWPRDLSGVALAAAALTLVALGIGWSGVPTQFGAEGAELAAGRTP